MTPKPIDYSKTIIYKIVCNDLKVADCYVGQTTDFKTRKNKHKSKCNNEKTKEYNCKVYKTIRDNGNWNNWEMIEIEKYPCNDANEARKRERYWLEELKANLNCDVPGRTQKEYYLDNKDKISEQKKEYYEDNKDKVKEQKKNYYEKNKDKKKEYDKEYQKKNKDKVNAKRREHYEKNKDEINEKKRLRYARLKLKKNIPVSIIKENGN
jgi:hypothetical protein